MIERITKFSEDRVYRYTLWRKIAESPAIPGFVMFIGLNPSTADETKDDPTIRRCKDFVKRWGYGELLMTNIFAFRSPNPDVMKRHPKPIGEDGINNGELNDEYLKEHALHAELVICAWGKHGKHLFRGIRVKRMLIENGIEPKCLRLLGDGSPEHPLYIPAVTIPKPFLLT